MLSKLSLLALVASTALTLAAPSDFHRALARQDGEYSFWELQLYTSGCDGEYDEHLSGTNDQTFPCTGSVTGWHNAKMKNMAANGLKVLLYADGGCLNQIGEVNRDDTCYAAPKDSVISAYGVVKA